jgi:hypothetical protein
MLPSRELLKKKNRNARYRTSVLPALNMFGLRVNQALANQVVKIPGMDSYRLEPLFLQARLIAAQGK